MIAWHGSPVLFDRFDAGKIGTQTDGGSQGYGMYVTDCRDIACSYAAPSWWHVRKGYVYEVEAPDGEYIDNSKFLDHQPEPVRAILHAAIEQLAGPMSGYWRFVIGSAPENAAYHSQIGVILSFSRKNGTPAEPVLAAAGYVGCINKMDDRGHEFAVFDPDRLRIRSVTPHEQRMVA
ncbi:MAG: hypothetical protein EOR88_11570 [Mesorhizobium sp.]|uniref:hypothetical protein n=1 Tax=Mesorhizobium sp. TaxID=1871066 RepID=UPI000FE65F39|nr:hypothetical protein [Mesorhizobium sp.]RWN19754.1 MAG: hypothetical protein EOR88_11570 [Mesorhizobium sp.]